MLVFKGFRKVSGLMYIELFQASARSGIVGNTASALTAQSAFLNNFGDIVNRRVDIRVDTKRYQDTLSYASSKVDYSVGEHLYMLPSDMTLKIRPGTVGYNNKILVSEKFIPGKNEKVNLMVPVLKSHKVTQTAAMPKRNSNDVLSHVPTISHKPQPITHNEEKIAFVLFMAGSFAIGIYLDKHYKFKYVNSKYVN